MPHLMEILLKTPLILNLEIEVSINGDTISTRPFEPAFTNNLYLRSYLSLYQGRGKFGSDWAPDITFEG